MRECEERVADRLFCSLILLAHFTVLRFTEPNGKVSVAGPEGPDAGRGPGRSLKKLLFGRPEGGQGGMATCRNESLVNFLENFPSCYGELTPT